MAFAASRMELELCFEDVARNVFGNEDGTMTRCVSVVSVAPPPHGWDVESPIGSVFVSSRRIRPRASRSTRRPRPTFPTPSLRSHRPQLAAILGADTGLALKPAELKVFISEFDVKERVTAEVFCAIYSYLASRPATPAPAEWAIDCVKAAFEKCGPAGPDKEVDKELLVSELEGMNLRDKGPVILASVKKKAPAVVDWPTVEKLARAGIGLVAGPEDASATGGGGDAGAAGGGDAGAAAGAPAPDAVAAATAFLSQPLARLVAAAGATFPARSRRQPEPVRGVDAHGGAPARRRRARRVRGAAHAVARRGLARVRRRRAVREHAVSGRGGRAVFALREIAPRRQGVGEAPVRARGGDAPARATRGQSVRDAPERRQRRLARVRDARGERARAGRRRPREGARAEKREVVVPRPAGACCASARFFAHTPLGFNVRSRRLSTDR